MERKIILNKQEVNYCFKVSLRARSLRLVIYPDGRVVVTGPAFFNQDQLQNFLTKKADWILKHLTRFQNSPPNLLPPALGSQYQKLRCAAQQLVSERLKHYNEHYRYHISCVAIRNQKSRWGSCSKSGRLNFNYRLLHLPIALADYVVVHELCHLGEFNHSPKYWALVQKTTPDYLRLRAELRQKWRL